MQYGPLKLPADILRLRDSMSDSTALVFRSGKLVIVHCLSWEHSRFCCHYYRLLLEQVQCVMRDPDTNRLQLTTLAGRTQFDNWEVHNSVGYGQLGCRVDLAAIKEAASHVCQYKPDRFPGLKLRVWIRDPAECKCESIKCPCKVQMLIFDTGRVIIVGARSTRDVNSVFYRFKALVPQYVDHGKQLPRNQRFEARVARILGHQQVGVPLEDMQNIQSVSYGGAKKRARGAKSEVDTFWDETLDLIQSQSQSQSQNHASAPQNQEGLTPFLRACLQGQEENVRWMLDMDYDAHVAERDVTSGKSALELLQDIPVETRSTQQEAIIRMLQVKRERKG